MGWSDDAARNRDVWTKTNAEYTDSKALASWNDEPRWGVWKIPDSELEVFGDVAGLDVVELGCGTAYVSAWLARAGARPVGVDITPAQLETVRRCATEHEYYGFVSVDWAPRWPAEEIWIARKR